VAYKTFSAVSGALMRFSSVAWSGVVRVTSAAGLAGIAAHAFRPAHKLPRNPKRRTA
jgi:hypothetical protein